MMDKFIKFKWSTYDSNEYVISNTDFINKRYKYYWKNIPIRSISYPIFVGTGYLTNVGLNDPPKYSCQLVNVDEIQDISDIRNSKINTILK